MPTFKISKVTALPSEITPDTIYIVQNTSAQQAELYFSSSDGSRLVPAINSTTVVDLIHSTVNGGGFNELEVVPDLAKRNALVLDRNTLVFVLNSLGDPSGSTGEALYLYVKNDNTFRKIYSQPTIVDWANINGGPQVSPAALDAAVAASHSHSNKSVLDKLGQSPEGYLTFNGGNPINVFLVEQQW